MTSIDLKKKPPSRPSRRDHGGFWDGFFLFGFFEALGDLLGAIFEGLGSN